MSELTKEWLSQKIAAMEAARNEIPFGLDEDDSNTLAALRIALASLEAEPVEVTFAMAMDFHHALNDGGIGKDDIEDIMIGLRAAFANITAPSAPVSVPDAMDDQGGVCCEVSYADGWNACRAAMLQGAENAESPTTMQTAPELDYSPKNAESPTGINQGKSEPVTTAYKLPEGWVAVPVEPTEDMIVNGLESEPNESFSDEKVWEAYDAMSGCQQAAHRAKLCWAAMISAAPKPDVR